MVGGKKKKKKKKKKGKKKGQSGNESYISDKLLVTINEDIDKEKVDTSMNNETPKRTAIGIE